MLMAFQLISQTPEALLSAFQSAVLLLLYPSETDAPVEVHTASAAEVGDAFLADDIIRLFYKETGRKAPHNFDWAEANRLESNGTHYFFRDLSDVLTTYPNNEFYIQEQAHRAQAPNWRHLRNLFFDNLVRQRWFRAELGEPDNARSDIYLVGQHLQIEIDPDTNETRSQLMDWFVLSTYVIET